MLATIVLSVFTAHIYVPVVVAADPETNSADIFNNLHYDGCFLSVFSLIEAPVVLGLIVLFIRIRRAPVFEYLSLNRFTARAMLVSILIILGLTIVYDMASVALDRPILPDFMIAIYETACFRPLLYIVIILVAPVIEELLFRGFMFEGIRHSLPGAAGAILMTSAVWAALHLQYDVFDVTAIFLLGIALGIIKVRYNTLYIPILIHMLVNFIATVQLTAYMNL